MSIKFSIITCTYNSEKYLQNNIVSVEIQTFQNYEHIFIDGNSTDKTIEIIKKYQKKYPSRNIKLFQIPPNGISNAMNIGIKKSSGEYLIHLHSDDSFYNSAILNNINLFIKNKKNPDWIYGKANITETNNKSIGKFPNRKLLQYTYRNFFGKQLLKYFNFIPHQAVFIKRSIFTIYGYFDESITSSMDTDLWLRIINNTRWFFFDKIICNYRIHANAQSSGSINKKENLKNLKTVQKRHLGRLEFFLSKILNKIINKLNKTIR